MSPANPFLPAPASPRIPRRVPNLTRVTRHDRTTASALFDSVRAHFRPLLA